MGLFKKKEEVPQIPAAPVLPELPKTEGQKEKKGLPELPSFPNTPQTENINQEIVKSAVTDMPPEENETSLQIPKDLQIKEEPSIASIPTPTAQAPSIASAPKKFLELKASAPSSPTVKQTEPIFVRIDKFQSAQKNFENIKEKMKEIESVLAKIKDVKSKEEVELKGWTEDVEKIKVRLAEVDSDIFNQI